MSHLLQAERRKPALDVSYIVFANRKQAESESSGTGAMSAINRVTFEKYAADVRRYVMKAAMRQVGFWAELALAPVPDLGRLHHLSSEMNDAVDSAERAFTQLFAINPQSLVVSLGATERGRLCIGACGIHHVLRSRCWSHGLQVMRLYASFK